MKKTMKKALAIILCLLMVVTTVPMTMASASNIITDEASLKEALETGGEYVLGNDIAIEYSVYHSNDVTTVIDLDGYKIGDTPWGITVSAGDLTIYNGKLNRVVPTVYSGSLTIKDVTIDATSSSAIQNHGGKLTLENVTLNGPYSKGVYATAGETVIIGGTYNCGDEEIISYYDEIPDVKVYGGTFSKSVADYVADDYIEVEKDGKFVVESNMKGTAGEGITWIIDYYGTLTISGTGYVDAGWYSAPWSEYIDLIKAIVVEEGITKIRNSAFADAENVKTVSLPSTLTSVGGMAFHRALSLEEINVAEENTSYKSIDGILFTEDEKTLVAYPAGKACEEYTIPASVTTIGKYAFAGTIVDTVIVPDTVTVIEEGAFRDNMSSSIIIGNGITTIPDSCFSFGAVKTVILSDSVKSIEYSAFWSTQLDTLVIGSGVESIAKGAFAYTYNLTTIHYNGTQEDWDKIAIEESDSAYDIQTKVIHFVKNKDEISATCTDGHTAGLYCDACGKYITGDVITATEDHSFDDGVVTPPTCFDAGYTTYTCTVCDYSYTGDEEDALGHNYGDDSTCDRCGEPCSHVDNNHDELCDYCDIAVLMGEAKLGVTGTVCIPEGDANVFVKFIPTESGTYVISSDNGGNDDEIDPYVAVYNSDFEEIALDDDNDYVNTYNFYCIFEAEAGETYYIALSAYEPEVEYDYLIEKYIVIDHQPTAVEPYVTLNSDVDAEYQWYSVSFDDMEITDENAEAYSYDGETATYDTENGWTPICDEYWDYSSATIELKAGDVITVEFTDSLFGFGGFYDWDADNESGSFSENDGQLVYTVEIDEDGLYTFYTDYYAEHKIYLRDAEYTAIEGETTDTLENPEIGTEYVCMVTLESGTVLTSDTFEYSYVITHQPTSAEPYVELNDDTDATYQWCSVTGATVEITDKNADVCNNYNGSEYDAATGWSGDYWEETGACFFGVYLKKGDVISLDFGEAVNGEIGIWDYDADDGAYEIYGTEDGKIELVAPWDGNYVVYAYGINSETRVKAYIGEYDYTPIEGETTNTLENPEFGTEYACKITHKNGTTLTSDIFEYSYAITHQPTSAEPYVELNDDTDATYQWYAVVGNLEEITDENAAVYPNFDSTSSYDPETGWTGSFIGSLEGDYPTYRYFIVELNAGDTISVELLDEVDASVVICGKETTLEWLEPNENGIYEYTVEYDDLYLIEVSYSGDEQANIRAYLGAYEYAPIDGATDDTYIATEDGFYACEVTFKDGTKEMSDVYKGPHAHAYDSVVTAPTCEDAGYTTYTCTGCGDEYTTDEVSALGHDYDKENGVLTRPTETEKGYYTYTCKNDSTHTTTEAVDGADYTEFDKAFGKIMSYLGGSDLTDEAKAELLSAVRSYIATNPNFDAQGNLRRDLIASEQGVVDEATAAANNILAVVEGELANCNAGNHTVIAYTPNNNATCTANGTKTGNCVVCGTEVTVDDDNVPALGHDMITDEAVDPTCTATGLTEGAHCSRCDDVTTAQTVVPALGHDMITDKAVNPTCTETGLTEGAHCSRCDDVTTAQTTIPATGHTPAEAVIENNVAPNCTTAGSYDSVVYCSVCTAEISRENKTVDATGHNYEAVVTAPTCTAQGYTTYTCSCGDSYVDNYTDATGHADNDGDGYCDADNELLDPTVECDCNCHESGIKKFFFKFLLFFQRIFGANKECSCGIAHY